MSHSVLWSSLSPLFPIAQFIPWSRNKSTWSLVGKHKKGSWSSTEATEKFKVSIRRHLKLKQKHYKWSENHQRLLFRPYTILAVYATTPLCSRSTKTADTSKVLRRSLEQPQRHRNKPNSRSTYCFRAPMDSPPKSVESQEEREFLKPTTQQMTCGSNHVCPADRTCHFVKESMSTHRGSHQICYRKCYNLA